MWGNHLRLTAVIVALVLSILPFVLLSGVALAATSAEVVVTATGYICEAPGGFTITYISDYELGLSWVKGEDAVNTMVRVKDGSMPTSRTDGNLIYYGDGTNASDTGVNFEEGTATRYYKAWSQNANGVWEESGSTNFMENPYMMLIGLIVLALGLAVSGYMLKRSFLAYGAAGAWLLLAVYAFTHRGVSFDIYWALFILSGALTIGSIFVPISFREAAGEEEDLDPDMADLRRFREEQQRDQEQYGFLYGNRPRRRRPPPRGTSLYR
jgi:hypothetical protein